MVTKNSPIAFMIQDIDQQLTDWIASILGSVQVFLEAPNQHLETTEGIGLYLFDLVYQPVASSVPRLPLEISLSYLVTAWAKTPQEEHQKMGELMFAAIDNPRFQIKDSALPLTLWQAFQVVPRPAFVLTVPLQQERPDPVAPLVRSVPIIHTSPTQTLRGTILGPENTPIAGAGITLPTLQRRTRTNRNGEFSFERVPTQPEVSQIQLQARGRHYAISLEPGSDRPDPLVIHLSNF